MLNPWCFSLLPSTLIYVISSQSGQSRNDSSFHLDLNPTPFSSLQFLQKGTNFLLKPYNWHPHIATKIYKLGGKANKILFLQNASKFHSLSGFQLFNPNHQLLTQRILRNTSQNLQQTTILKQHLKWLAPRVHNPQGRERIGARIPVHLYHQGSSMIATREHVGLGVGNGSFLSTTSPMQLLCSFS